MSRRAFTLIELLVVIAIIAVLAAILFPVFAGAKVAAKGAASLSNIKQLGVTEMLYSGDYDDMQVLGGNADADAPFLLGESRYKSWGWLLVPYAKNYAIFQDPLTQMESQVATLPDGAVWAYHTQFGYASSIHSPTVFDTGTGKYSFKPLSSTAIARPAETVLFVKKKIRNRNLDWFWIGSLLWGGNAVNPPTCNAFETVNIVPKSVCIPNNYWGTGATSYSEQTFEEGGLTGGVAWRKNGLTLVTWADGHAKTVNLSTLAGGTNFTKTTPASSVVLTDKEKFVWDAE